MLSINGSEKEPPNDAIWYDDKIKDLNTKIWYPEHVSINNDPLYKFHSKIINFESFKSEDNYINHLNLKNVDENNYYKELINLQQIYINKIKKNNKESQKLETKYNAYIIGLIETKFNDYDKKFHDKFKKTIQKNEINFQNIKKWFKNSVDMIGKGIITHKVYLDLNKEQSKKVIIWMNECDKLYNYCVELFNTDANFPKNYMSGKLYVFQKIYNKEKKPVPYNILTYVVKEFYSNLASCFTNLERGNIKIFKIAPKKLKDTQTISIEKADITENGIYITLLKCIKNFKKNVNIENIACDCKLSYNKVLKKFTLYIPQYKNYIVTNKEKKPVCAIDPGEKIFATFYSLDDYGFIGDNIRVPILKIEQKIRKYQRLLNKTVKDNFPINKKTKKGKAINRKKIIKKINKLYKQIKGIVNELHKKTALYLCKNYNTILIPEFQTKQMVSNKIDTKKKVQENKIEIKERNKDNSFQLKQELKTYKKANRLNSRVKFVLNQQSHYKFRQHLLCKAKEHGCVCIIVTEEYTSQLCTKCGNLDKTYVNRVKKCKHCGHEIHRDVNGARNILLKNLPCILV